MATRNENLQALALLDAREHQLQAKSWVGDRLYLPVDRKRLLPFQWRFDGVGSLVDIVLVNVDTGARVSYLSTLANVGLSTISLGSFSLVIYPGVFDLQTIPDLGRYFFEVDWSGQLFYSDRFCVVNSTDALVDITYWHQEDIVQPGSVLQYVNGYRSRLLLQAEIAYPLYGYEEQVKEIEGRVYPLQQVTFKRWRFTAVATEQILDALRGVALHDNCVIRWKGREYIVDRFEMSDPEWDDYGDVAAVQCEFRTDTLVVVNGRGASNSDSTLLPKCIDADFVAVAEVVAGSDEHLFGRYVNADGLTKDLIPGEYIVELSNAAGDVKTLRSWDGNGYVDTVILQLQVVYVQANQSYYLYDASVGLTVPRIDDIVNGNVSGVTFSEGIVNVETAGQGTSNTVLGSTPGATFNSVGIDIVIPPNVSFIRLRAVSLACPDLIAYSAAFDVSNLQPSGSGIGWMTIGSTFIVG